MLLVGLEGVNYKDAARILDIPVGTVMSRLSRDRESLRTLVVGGSLDNTPHFEESKLTSREPYSDTDIHAYVDGRIDERERGAFEAWLRENPQAATQVESYLHQNEQLHAHYDHIVDEAVPTEMGALMVSPRPLGPASVLLRLAASLVILLAGAVGGWGLRGLNIVPETSGGLPSYVERAVGAHIVYAGEIRHPVEVGVKQEDHLVAWLSKRLGNPIRAPRLQSIGYELIGGRLLEDAGRPAAQFMYEDDAGRRVTVYVRSHHGKETAFKFSGDGGVSAFYWIDSPFAYALAGDIPRQELLKLAHIVYEDLTQ